MPQVDYHWTNHARQRLHERKISVSLVEETISAPDRIIHRPKGSIEIQKKLDERIVTALIKQNDRGEHIIVSCWVNPPFPGTKDYRMKNRYRQMQKAHGMKKFWLHMLYQLGL